MPADCKIQKTLRGSLKLFISVPGRPKDAQTLGYGPLPIGVCVSAPRDLASGTLPRNKAQSSRHRHRPGRGRACLDGTLVQLATQPGKPKPWREISDSHVPTIHRNICGAIAECMRALQS